MSEQMVGTLHAHNEHQVACPHCEFAARELLDLQERARWLEGRLTELEKQDEIHWKTRRTLLTEKESLEARLEVCQRLYEELGQQIDERVRRRVREAILALPPKGAGDEVPPR